MKKIFIEYAELKKQEKIIADAIEEKKPLIIKEMKEKGQDKIPTEFGSFRINELPRWTYSEDVKKMEVKLSKLKEKEQQTGVAVETKVLSLVFNAPKEEK